jgi:hypothetical protein
MAGYPVLNKGLLHSVSYRLFDWFTYLFRPLILYYFMHLFTLFVYQVAYYLFIYLFIHLVIYLHYYCYIHFYFVHLFKKIYACAAELNTTVLEIYTMVCGPQIKAEVLKLWGAPPRGGGATCFYEGYIYFELNMGAR